MVRWFYKLPLRFRSLFRKSRVEQELGEEFSFHLEELTAYKRAHGMTPEDARYAALRELGGVEQIKEECRATRRVNLSENFLQDIRGWHLRCAPFAILAPTTTQASAGHWVALEGRSRLKKPPTETELERAGEGLKLPPRRLQRPQNESSGNNLPTGVAATRKGRCGENQHGYC